MRLEAGLARPGRSLLRAACSSQHARLDALVSDRLDSGSPGGYRHFLRGSRRLWLRYRDVADTIAMRCGIAPMSAEVLDWLARDIRKNSAGEPPDSAAAPEPCPLADLEHMLGQAYVLEGSSLGASVLLKRMRRALPGASHEYLDGQSRQAGTRWPRFAAQLETLPSDPARMVDGAIEAFESAWALFAAEQ